MFTAIYLFGGLRARKKSLNGVHSGFFMVSFFSCRIRLLIQATGCSLLLELLIGIDQHFNTAVILAAVFRVVGCHRT